MKPLRSSLLALAVILLLVSAFAVACGEAKTPETTAAPATTAAPTDTTAAQTDTTAAPTDSTAAPSGKAIELSLASQYPSSSDPSKSLERWGEKIAADSGGRLTVRHFSDQTLVSGPEMRIGVAAGTADLGSSAIYKPEPGFDPSVVLSQIILGLNYDDCLSIFADIWNEFPELWAGQWEKFKLIWITVSDPNLIVTVDTPVRTLADMKGLQLRIPSKYAAEMMKDLGAAPVEMSTGDWVVSLDKGTTDGAATSVGMVIDHQIAEKVKYVTKFGAGTGVQFLAMNKDKYESLPADLQKIIDDNMEFGRQDFVKTKKDAETAGYEYMKGAGMEIIDLSLEEYEKWNAAVRPTFDMIAADLDKAGFPGTELVNFALERAQFYLTN